MTVLDILTFQGSIAKKPYNPIIGETFQCSWSIPDCFKSTNSQPTRAAGGSDADDNGLVNNLQESAEQTTESNDCHVTDEVTVEHEPSQKTGKACTRLLYCAEQVSHHPPGEYISAHLNAYDPCQHVLHSLPVISVRLLLLYQSYKALFSYLKFV